MCVSVCLPDPVSSSLVQSVMSMASSHSQHSHISTDTMSSMSGSYLAGAEGEPGGDDGGDAEAEENQDAPMESRGPSQQDGVRNPGMEGWLDGGETGCKILKFIINAYCLLISFSFRSFRSFPRSQRNKTTQWL